VVSDIKTQGMNISASVLVSWLSIGAFAWLFAEPRLIQVVSIAMAEDVRQTVQAEIAPVTNALGAIIAANILQMQEVIAREEFRRDNPPEDDWTSEDAIQLVRLKTTLIAQEKALAELGK